MRIIGYEADGEVRAGLLDEAGAVTPLGKLDHFWKDPQRSLREAHGTPPEALPGRRRPPIPAAARVICIGLNYRLHAAEAKLPTPAIPVVFGRWANTLCVDGTPAPAIDPKFDWECELGVVIGRRMFRVDKEQGLKGVFGYCAFNDLSARTFQLQTPQWTLGKNSAASGPMSEIVTSDVTGDPGLGLRICTRVNGETMQDSTTADMIFSVGELVAHLSQALILEPGDLIVTGTPSGVGMARGKFLKAGDVVEVEIEKIGVVRTPIIALPEPIF